MFKKHTTTIFTRICIPLFIVMLLQTSIFYFVTVYGHVVDTLNSNAADIMTERVNNRQNELESMFTSQWVNTEVYMEAINKVYDSYRRENVQPFYADADQKKGFLEDASPTLFSMLRNNGVNGVFIILNNSDSYEPVASQPQSYYGLCIRDYDLTSGYTDKEDLLIERSPSSIATALGCPLDSYWEALYTFSTDECQGDFFYKPLRVAYENPGASSGNLAYMCGPHEYGSSDPTVISYSMPLISSDGQVYGVIGVELTVTYLSTLLPSRELEGPNDSAYMLVQYDKGSSDFSVVAEDGTLFQRCFGDDSSFSLNMSSKAKESNKLYSYTGRQNLTVCCSISPLAIYNRNTPFENEIFALVGVARKDALFSISSEIRKSLLIVTAFALCIGLGGIFIVSHLLALPIKKLGKTVQSMGPSDDVSLEHTNILEIDQLVDAIETQSHTINQSKVRTEFFSRMSHDMRTPMNAIIGFSSPEVLDGCEKPQLLEYLGKINGSGKYLLGLINEVLDMTKIDSGRMELDAKPFKTKTFWDGILPMIDELAARKNLNFVKNFSYDGDQTVTGDSQRLSQVIINLLSNSVKFTPSGGTVTLSVSENKLADNQLAFDIMVSDTGMGMSKEFQEKMYQPFAQEHPNKEGTGLGLSIAYQLITFMRGTIKCESKEGEGTTFRIKLMLPLSGAQEEKKQDKQEYSEDELNKILSGKHILLCEDHPLNRQIACRLLSKKNMTVETAENGKIGSEMFEGSELNHFDAVLMDIRMPLMDGLETARTIRSLARSDAKTVPIIAMTANAFQEDMDASAAAGMNAHLAKPIEPHKLYQTLAQQMRKMV